MKINVKKTEVMKVDDDLTPIKVTVAGVYLRQVHSFKYLGAYFNSEHKKLSQDWQLVASEWPN